MLGLTFFSKLDWGSYIIFIAETSSKKIGAVIHSMNFLSPEIALYLCKCTICPCVDTFLTSGLVLLVATWSCQASFKNKYTGLVLHLLLLMNPWLIVKIWPVLSLVQVFLWQMFFRTVSTGSTSFFFEGGLLIIPIDCMIFLSPYLDVTRMSMLTVSFLDSGILCLQNDFL